MLDICSGKSHTHFGNCIVGTLTKQHMLTDIQLKMAYLPRQLLSRDVIRSNSIVSVCQVSYLGRSSPAGPDELCLGGTLRRRGRHRMGLSLSEYV